MNKLINLVSALLLSSAAITVNINNINFDVTNKLEISSNVGELTSPIASSN